MITITNIIYFIVVFASCVLGATVGLGGGMFVRPVFDAFGYHNVINISFFSSSAILTMAVVSTIKKVKDGTKIDITVAVLVSMGAIFGGVLGNLFLEHLLGRFYVEAHVQLIQIAATIAVLTLSLFLTTKKNLRYEVKNKMFFAVLGSVMGMVGAFLGMGGGPINVPFFMIFFGLSIKDATAYSIVIIFFAHLSRLITMGWTVGYGQFDLPVLLFIVPAAALGGFVGAKVSKIFSESTVKKLFLATISSVIVLNLANGAFLMWR